MSMFNASLGLVSILKMPPRTIRSKNVNRNLMFPDCLFFGVSLMTIFCSVGSPLTSRSKFSTSLLSKPKKTVSILDGDNGKKEKPWTLFLNNSSDLNQVMTSNRDKLNNNETKI